MMVKYDLARSAAVGSDSTITRPRSIMSRQRPGVDNVSTMTRAASRASSGSK